MRLKPLAALLCAVLAASLTVGVAAPADAAAKKKAHAFSLTLSTTRVEQATTAWSTVKVKIKNTGSKTAASIVLKVTTSAGAKATPTKVTVKKLKPGATKTVSIKVKRVRASGAVKIVGTSAGAAKHTVRVTVATPQPPAPTNPLVGHGYWHWQYEAFDSEAGYSHLYFANAGLAYWGLLTDALPTCAAATITALTAGASGCIAYAYSPATGAVSIGGAVATLTPTGQLTFPDGSSYDRIDYPEAGTAIDLALEHIGYSGCSGLPYCSTWTSDLVTNAAGQFILSESSLTTMDIPGGPFTAGGSYPPDTYGTYAIVARGVIELRFADGHVEHRTLGYIANAGGATAPQTEGVFLGSEYFWVDDD